MKVMGKRTVFFLLALVVSFVLAIPSASAFRLFKIGAKQEMSMGLDIVNETDKEYLSWKNPVIESRIGDIVKKLLVGVKRKGLAWQVGLYDTKEDEGPIVNAFCAPGGYIRVFRGLVEQTHGKELLLKLEQGTVTKEDEPKLKQADAMLEAVLAHEMGHAENRDSIDGLQNSLGIAIFLGILTGGDPSTIEKLTASFLSSKYSRKQETDADIAGLTYLYLAGENPLAMVEMLGMLEGLGGNLPKPLSYLSTHPNPGDRAKRISGLIPRVILEQGKNRPAAEPILIGLEIVNLNLGEEKLASDFREELAEQLNQTLQVKVVASGETAARRLMIDAGALVFETLAKDKKGVVTKVKLSGDWQYSIKDEGGEAVSPQKTKASGYTGSPAKISKSWLSKETERAAIFGLAHLLGYAGTKEEVVISLD